MENVLIILLKTPMLHLARLCVVTVLLFVVACATFQKDKDEGRTIEVVHLTQPNAAPLPELKNPSQQGNVLTGTADLGEKPLARIETQDGYAPDTPTLFESTQSDQQHDTPTDATVDTSQPSVVVVQKGDTVYSIARKYGMTVQQLAAANNLDQSFTIRPGQELRIDNKQDTAFRTELVTENTAPESGSSELRETTTPPKPTQETAAQVIALPSKTTKGQQWSWPLQGKITLLKSFKATGSAQGMDLQGQKGDPVYAANDGTVVYSGNELKGFGNLIILSHKGDYMSAYAHNSRLLIEVDDKVKRGQKIAEVGSVESDKVKLFFQIRHRGEPIDPAPLLPKQ